MEGPTPVSALIHAATMVTAGVYMVARSSAIYQSRAGRAARRSCRRRVHRDLRRVDRPRSDGYQEGPGLFHSQPTRIHVPRLRRRRYAAGVFHLMTHAFFKALLFLGAGSVIHGMGGIQDIRKMGGLRHQNAVDLSNIPDRNRRDRRNSAASRDSSARTRFCGAHGTTQLRKAALAHRR